MTSWKHILNHIANDAEDQFDRLKFRLHERLGGLSPLKIIPYNGFGRADKLYIKGRVLEDRHVASALANDTLWDNLVNMYRRLESNEIPFAQVLVSCEGVEQEVTADEEGFFEAWIEPKQPFPPNNTWQPVQLRLLSPRSPKQQGDVEATGRALIAPPTAKFAVISDIDDTIIQTDATHLIRMARNVFLSNARTRLPFPGVAAFYRALLDGPNGNDLNPLFFVSSSPWNLYDLLVDFFALQDIPLGPVLFLRDWGLTENEILPVKNLEYKKKVIQQLMSFYPKLPFILIGDSGQEDPEIYQSITAEFPDRVLAVYIRNVSHDLKRPQAIRALAEKVIQAHSTLILADDTLSIAQHAAKQGWIAPQALHAIGVEKRKDEAPPTPLEKLVGQEEKPEGPTVVVQKPELAHPETGQKPSIEEAMKESKEKGEKPPTVIVKNKDGESHTIDEDQKGEGG